MTTATFLHPTLAGKTTEQVAKWAGLKPDTPAFLEYVQTLERLNSPEANERKRKFFEEYIKLCRSRKDTAPLCTPENVANAWDHWLLASSLYDFQLDDEDLKTQERRYTVLRLIEGNKPWPTGHWFRFAQTRWEKSRWHVVPAFPSAMLALAGYKLASSWRYMGDLVDHDKARLFEIQLAAETRKLEREGDRVLTPDEEWDLKTLLDQCPTGGELAILDIDSGNAADAKEAKERGPEWVRAENRRRAEASVPIALETHRVWKEITGADLRWTVTNDRGGLHGRSLLLPPNVRHRYMLRALSEEVARRLTPSGTPYKVKGEDKESSAAVALDLTAFNKYPWSRGGQWRLPGCVKTDSEGRPKAGSLPQSPVHEHLREMPWLAPLTAGAIGTDWTVSTEEGSVRILNLCETHQKHEDEKEVRVGARVRDKDGRSRKVRSATRVADESLGTTEFRATAEYVREVMPKGDHESIKRHNVRLAIAGWLQGIRLPEEATLATLRACGGNQEDSEKAVRTTYSRAEAGERIAGFHKLAGLLGKDVAEKLRARIVLDLEERWLSSDKAERLQAEAEAEGRAAIEDQDDGEDGPSAADHDPESPEDEPPSSATTTSSSSATPPVKAVVPPSGASPSDPSKPAATAATGASDARPGAPSSVRPSPAPAGEDEGDLDGVWPNRYADLFHEKGKEFLDPTKSWTPVAGNEVLVKTIGMLKVVKDTFTSEPKKLYFVQSVIGENLFLAGVGASVATQTSRDNRHGVKFSQIRDSYQKAKLEFRNWRPGKTRLPKIDSFKRLEKTLGWKLWEDLKDAIDEDLADAPFGVSNRILRDQTWSSRQRANMKLALDRLQQRLEKDGKKGLRGLSGGTYQAIYDVIHCCRMGNRRLCPGPHGIVATIPIVCEREVGCRWCRSRRFEWIERWVRDHWVEEEYVILNWRMPDGPVEIDVKEDVKEGEEPKYIVENETPDSEYAAVKHLDEATSHKYRFAKKERPDERRFRFVDDGEGGYTKVKWKLQRRPKSRKVGTRLSNDPIVRAKKGFNRTNDMKRVRSRFKTLPLRAFPAPDGMFVIMPNEFAPTVDAEGFPNNVTTSDFLRSAGLFQGSDCQLRIVKKDEMISEMLKSRARIGLSFDEVVDKYMKIARRVNTTKEEQEESDRVEAELLEHPFLKNNVMKPIKTKAAEEALLWFTNDQMRDYLSKIRDAERGYSVKSHECPVPVKQPDGTEKPCCMTLVNELVEMRTGGVFGRNSEGKFVSKKEAWPIGDENGVSVGYHHHFAPKFASTPARC